MDISLEGRVALISGASRGIGKAIARSFSDAGARVMLSSRKLDQLEATAGELPGECDVVAANTGDPSSGEAAVQATLARFGALDILVNNAATNPYYGPTLGVDDVRWAKTVDVNLRGPLLWSQAAWQLALKDRAGVILNIASVGGVRAEGGLGVYNLTKAALIHLTRQLAGEIGPSRVVGIAPGLVRTDFAAYLVDHFGEGLAKGLPLRRLGEPQDIANLATFLVSDLASWITGETYIIDGGAGVRSAAP